MPVSRRKAHSLKAIAKRWKKTKRLSQLSCEIENQSLNNRTNFMCNLGALRSHISENMACKKCGSDLSLHFTRLKLFTMDFKTKCSNEQCTAYKSPIGFNATNASQTNFDEVRGKILLTEKISNALIVHCSIRVIVLRFIS